VPEVLDYRGSRFKSLRQLKKNRTKMSFNFGISQGCMQANAESMRLGSFRSVERKVQEFKSSRVQFFWFKNKRTFVVKRIGWGLVKGSHFAQQTWQVSI